MNYSLKDILKSLKILFVSKKEDISQKEIDILEMFFHKIIYATSEDRALRIYSEEHPDVIITDIELTNGLGIELCKEIRKLNPSIPIIILSENTDSENLLQIIRLQVVDFIKRPMKVENMIFALNQTAKHVVNHGSITIRLFDGSIYNYKEKTILKEGNSTKLTKNEFRLLELLLANKHKKLSKDEIETSLWGEEDITQSAFKSLFSRLRQKIGKDNIQNSFGVGYQLL